jgi:hypothetical protein
VRKLTVREIQFLEAGTAAFSLAGILVSLLGGNLYRYLFHLWTVPGIGLNIRMMNVSVFLYSCLALAIFCTLLVLNENDPTVRYWNYVQGWLVLTIAATGYEVLYTLLAQAAASTVAGHVIQQPYTLFGKGASVILFGALYVFYVIEKKKP